MKQTQASPTLLVFLFHGVGGGHSLNADLSYLKAHKKETWVAPMVKAAEKIKAEQESAAAKK